MLQGASQADTLTLARQHAESGCFDDFLTLTNRKRPRHCISRLAANPAMPSSADYPLAPGRPLPSTEPPQA